MVGIRGKGIISPYAEVGVDVDKPDDLRLAQQYLGGCSFEPLKQQAGRRKLLHQLYLQVIIQGDLVGLNYPANIKVETREELRKVKFSAVILAAGKGVRMRSQLPKVVHQVAGKPMVVHVADAVRQAGIERQILVVGHGRQAVEALFPPGTVEFAVQAEQLGHWTCPAAGCRIRSAGMTPSWSWLETPPYLQAATLKALID